MVFMIVSTVGNRLCPTKIKNYNGFNVSYHVTILFEFLIIQNELSFTGNNQNIHSSLSLYHYRYYEEK